MERIDKADILRRCKCGEVPQVIKRTLSPTHSIYIVGCCAFELPAWGDTLPEAINSWNGKKDEDVDI